MNKRTITLTWTITAPDEKSASIACQDWDGIFIHSKPSIVDMMKGTYTTSSGVKVFVNVRASKERR